MATVDSAQSRINLKPQLLQQNTLLRPRSPSSPQVLSRPTMSRRKASLSSSEFKKSEMGTFPPQHVILRSSIARQDYSIGVVALKSRPIHSMYSTSQPHLNVEDFDVKLRTKSRTTDNYEQRNRWSTVGIGENPDNGFDGGSIGKNYDLTLTKRSVEDLRPLPIPVAAPKVPPRRGSRLTTVPDHKYQENLKAEPQDRRYRETRSCEDLLENVSSPPKVSRDAIIHQAPQQYDHTHSQSTNCWYLPQPRIHQPGSTTMHITEPSRQGESEGTANETEKTQMITNYTTQPTIASSQLTSTEHQRSVQLVSHQVTNGNIYNNAQQSLQTSLSTERGVSLGISAVNTEPETSLSDNKGHYHRSTSEPLPQSNLSTEYIYINEQTQGSIPDSAYSSDAGLSSVISQQSSPTPPVDVGNDANLSVTPHAYSSPSLLPRTYTGDTTTALINVLQDHQPCNDNNLTVAPSVPHYAIPTNSSREDMLHIPERVVTANSDAVQSLSVVQGGPHSYSPEPDCALKITTPSNSEFYHSQPQYSDSVDKSQATMSEQVGSMHSSLSQPVTALSQIKMSQKSSVGTDSHSQGVSQNTQALVQAFNQWQYQGTTKRKHGSSKQNESKPPVKPKPASLLKGGSLSLKRDKNKSQKSAEGSTTGKKSGLRYVFKQSQSGTLLSSGRTPSQVDPLTDVGMEINYGTYTPEKHYQSTSASSSDPTLKDELTFTENPKAFAFANSGPSPNSYDYGSQMTLTGSTDATLTPDPSMNGSHSPPFYEGYRDGLVQPAMQSINGAHAIQNPTCTLQQPHSSTNTKSCSSMLSELHMEIPSSVSNSMQASNSMVMSINSTSTTTTQALAHGNPPSPHPFTNNGYTPVGSHLQISGLIPSDFKHTSPLAPIAEVSEQSTTSLLSTTEQTDGSSYDGVGKTEQCSSSDVPLNNPNCISQTSGGVGVSESLDEVEGKTSPTVQRSSTLPSAYKRPKPYRFNPTKYVSVDIQEQSSEPMSSEAAFNPSSMTLSDFTALNTSAFPKHVKISNSFMCAFRDVKLAQGDLLDLHFVRQTKAVVLVSTTGEEYVIPLNSAIKFAMIYDPRNTSQLIHQGYHFKSVGELIAMRQMPKVVVATETYHDSKPQSSVETGEILVICGVVNQSQGKVLKVNSTTLGKKFLDERCTANFSTRSDITKLSLNDMFKASMQLPLQADIYPPSGLQLPDSLTDAPVTLKRFCVIKSVIATPSSPEEYSPTCSVPLKVYDISLELDIEILECSELSDKQTIEMRTKTQQLYSSFEPAKVIPFYHNAIENKEQLFIQSALLTNVDLKGKFLGVQLELPEWLGQIRMSKAKQTMSLSQRESLSQPLLSLDNPQSEQIQYFKHGSVSIPFQSSALFQDTPPTIEQRMVGMEKQCRRMDNKINTLIQSFTEIVKQLTILKKLSKQWQSDSEKHQGHDQYVDMMFNMETHQVSIGSDQKSPLQSADKPNGKSITNEKTKMQLMKQQLLITNDEFEGVKEWQKKQEKHIQWQQEQVQHWQIECEKQMQEMQQKLIHLEDRQMKFFLETQQKLKQWKSMEQEKVVIDSQHEEMKQVCVDDNKKDQLGMDQNVMVEKPKLPPKPKMAPSMSDNENMGSQSPVKMECTKEDSTKRSENDDTEFGLDLIADNIASWCSQMELELKELYTNSVESHQ